MKTYKVYDDSESTLCKTAEALVADGVKYLDLAADQGVINKDWRCDIDLDVLNLYSDEYCVLGQIWGEEIFPFDEAAFHLARNVEIGSHVDLKYIQDCLQSLVGGFPRTPQTRVCGFYMECKDLPIAEQYNIVEPFYAELATEWKKVLSND